MHAPRNGDSLFHAAEQRLVNFSMPLQAQSGDTVARTYVPSPSSRLRA